MPAVPGSATLLPCIVGRAFTPAGEVCGWRDAAVLYAPPPLRLLPPPGLAAPFRIAPVAPVRYNMK